MFFLKELPTREMIEAVTKDVDGVPPDRVREVLERLRAASVLMRDIEGFLREHDLTQTQFLSLMMIVREPDRDSLSAAEIASRLDVSKPVLSKALRTLTDKGLIAPAALQPRDKRQRQLSVTAAGQCLFASVLPEYFSLLQRAKL